MYVAVGGQKYPVYSFAEASQKYRGVIEATGVGAREVPLKYSSPLILDQDGNAIGHIAYNGKVFPGRPEDWKPGLRPLYNPYSSNPNPTKSLRVLIACEFSQVVTEAFRKRGHEAVSCDLLPAEKGYPHIQDDVLRHLNEGWDIMIAHPPCTHLAISGARWFAARKKEQAEAIEFVRALMNAPISRIAIENPIGIISTHIRKPDQTIQPWMFGHGETKATCLWLKNLPLLKPTKVVEGRIPRVHYEAPGPERWKRRSRSYQGIAEAMAEQWGSL